jgi:hypothetical protein
MTAHIQRLDRGRVRADLVQSGRLVDTAEFASEAAARRWLDRRRREEETQPGLDLAGDQPTTLTMEI